MFVRYEEMFILAVTKQNAHAALVFEFLHKLIFLLKSYFDGKLTEESLKDNFALVYELLDEIVDFGYPQNCEPAVLKQIITSGGMCVFVCFLYRYIYVHRTNKKKFTKIFFIISKSW